MLADVRCQMSGCTRTATITNEENCPIFQIGCPDYLNQLIHGHEVQFEQLLMKFGKIISSLHLRMLQITLRPSGERATGISRNPFKARLTFSRLLVGTNKVKKPPPPAPDIFPP